MKAGIEIEMPETCKDCKLHYEFVQYGNKAIFCPYTGEGQREESVTGRQKDCPLKPMKEISQEVMASRCRALQVAVGALKYRPDLHDLDRQNYEYILCNMRDEISGG